MISLTSEYFPPIELGEISLLFKKKGEELTKFLTENQLKTKKIGRKTYVSVISLYGFIDTLPKTSKEYERRVIEYNIRLAKENKLLTYATLVRKMRKINQTLTDTYYLKGTMNDATNLNVNIVMDDSIQIDIDPIGYGLSYSEVKRIITNIRNEKLNFINPYEMIKEKIELKKAVA
ncbi:MAG TPA: hypothetical protein PLM93_11130 [Sulfuricurvum sp.]|nr:MAG: hypothetical protein B7X89_12075 [Sulfuricurvum sp. 17-40-25]HQS67725.1 hypothetical protein [Sulfuricurvum sp.]